jgi:hypothetical protein
MAIARNAVEQNIAEKTARHAKRQAIEHSKRLAMQSLIAYCPNLLQATQRNGIKEATK